MTKTTRAPQNRVLPELDDPINDALDRLAADYADLGDQRRALTEERAALKTRLLAELARQHRQTYHHRGVAIWIVRGADDVKVTVHPEDDEDEDDDGPPAKDPTTPRPPAVEDAPDLPAPREEPPHEERPRTHAARLRS